MKFPRQTIHDVDPESLSGKRVLVRVDFNVPVKDGIVTDLTRLEAVKPTIRQLIDSGAKSILISHRGRPGGEVDDGLRLDPIVQPLEELLKCEVAKARDVVGTSARAVLDGLESGQVALLENLRFAPGEKANDADFARSLGQFAEVYVNDAFGACHRAHASITGVPKFVSPAVAGDLVQAEYQVLHSVHENPERPFAALLGGAKISDKLGVIETLLDRADFVLVGGAMAFTFMLAEGGEVGDSLVERDFIDDARRILKTIDEYSGDLVLPPDVLVADELSENARTKTVPYGQIPDGWQGVDIGSDARRRFIDILKKMNTVFWNGPLGVFEIEPFAQGTNQVARAMANHSSKVVVGGGDSAAAVNQAGIRDRFHHISTGGGASLDLVENGSLPGIDALDSRS